MDIASILVLDDVLCKSTFSSKKRTLESIALHIDERYSLLDADEVFNAFIARERLGSTGIGHGIAIPHCRVSNCDNVIGVLVTLDRGIDFDAIDGELVDIVFALVVSEHQESEHLKTLSLLAERFLDQTFVEKVRTCVNREPLYEFVIQ